MRAVVTSTRLGCSTITFRKRSLPEALAAISRLGLKEIDLGMLPGVCEHVPMPPTDADITTAVEICNLGGLDVRTVNADPGDLAGPGREGSLAKVDALARLTAALSSKILVLPCGPHKTLGLEPATEGAVDRMIGTLAETLSAAGKIAAKHGIRLLVEAHHIGRLCSTSRRALVLLDALPNSLCGVVLDVSHVAAAGDDLGAYVDAVAARTEHVHLRDAVVGNINLSIGRGSIDFGETLRRLEATGYAGHYTLELETHDITDDERESAALEATHFISGILEANLHSKNESRT